MYQPAEKNRTKKRDYHISELKIFQIQSIVLLFSQKFKDMASYLPAPQLKFAYHSTWFSHR